VTSEATESAGDLQADVVVIGGGGAGLAAALSALEKGCNSVLVLEKQPAPGGSTAMAHDIFGIEPGSETGVVRYLKG
jgi:fumarate reductase flavoprotein subunit